VLDVLERERLMESVRLNSVRWHADLKKLAVDFPSQVLGLRGLGFMVGIQMSGDPSPYIAALREAGLLVPSAGGNVVRLLPPLTATVAELDQSVEFFRSVLSARA